MSECTVCALKAEGATHFPEPLPEVVFMCTAHWNTYLAMALGPRNEYLATRVELIAEQQNRSE